MTFCIQARDLRDGTGQISVVVHGDHWHCRHGDREVGHESGYDDKEKAVRSAQRVARFLDHGEVNVCDCARARR